MVFTFPPAVFPYVILFLWAIIDDTRLRRKED